MRTVICYSLVVLLDFLFNARAFSTSLRVETPATTLTRVVIAVKQRNLDKLRKRLELVSDPSSAVYGQYLTREEIGILTRDDDAHAALLGILYKAGVTVSSSTTYFEYIVAEAPIWAWIDLFAERGIECASALSGAGYEHLSLPDSLAEHATAVFALDLPIPLRKGAAISPLVSTSRTVTPSLLNSYYAISSNTGSQSASQAVYERSPQTFSDSDLAAFQSKFGLPSAPVAQLIDGTSSDSVCSSAPSQCIEGNLDVQYLTAVSQVTPTTVFFDSSANFVLGWILAVSNLASPSLVYSISWGAQEYDITTDYVNAFDTEALKLSAQGVTIVASSGDDGVNDPTTRGNADNCGYSPLFPASSQYVTSVGGTFGPEQGLAEVACQSDKGGDITTGGGFSTLASVPSFQSAAVASYFSGLNSAQQPVGGYSTNGRGYPDVALLAHAYEVIIGGQDVFISGTSASAPVFAGMVSLVNAARLEQGKGPLGWLNPALYQQASSFIRDISEGNNNCVPLATGSSVSVPICCTQGFAATTGWDPVTGLGSVDFASFMNTFVNL